MLPCGHQRAHGTLRHLLAVLRPRPASGQVRAARCPCSATACARSRDVSCLGLGLAATARNCPPSTSEVIRMAFTPRIVDATCSHALLTRLAPRLWPPDARSRGCQHLEPRVTVGSPRLGPPAHSLGWTPIVPAIPRRCLPCTPPVVCVPRRKPPRNASSVLRGRRSLRGWTPRRPAGWLPALRFVSSGPHATSLSLGLRTRNDRALGPRRRLDRASMAPAPPALRQPAWGRVRLRVSTGAGLCCPPSLRRRLQPCCSFKPG